jgi:hypothetical protein
LRLEPEREGNSQRNHLEPVEAAHQDLTVFSTPRPVETHVRAWP